MFKLTLYDNNHIIIRDFNKLVDITDDYIEIDNYLVKGKFLKITTLCEGMLELHGEIKEIIIM